MITAQVSEYRRKLAAYHQRILTDHDPLRISSKTGDIVDSLEMATVKALNVFSRRAKRMAEASVAS